MTQTDQILFTAVNAMADATDEIVPGAGDAYRRFADNSYSALGRCDFKQYEHCGPHERIPDVGQRLPPFGCKNWQPDSPSTEGAR